MEPAKTETVDVAIIGAGWYGLVAARTYLRLRPSANVVIIDSDSTVGGVWSESRLYPNLVAQVNLGLFNYTDTPMPATGANNKKQVSGRMIHDYLQRYAEDHDLLRRVRFNTHVAHAARGADRRGWLLRFRDSPDTLQAEKLLVATGVTSIPSLPQYLSEKPSVPVMHSRDLGQAFPTLGKESVKRVVVVGAAKSAYDAVYLLLSMGKQVTWVIRPRGAGPLAILPAELLGWWTSIGVASTRLMTGLSPSVFNTSGPLWAFFQQSLLGRKLTGVFWDVVALLSDLHAGYYRGGHVAKLRPEIDGKSVFWANSGLGVVTLPDFWRTIHNGHVTIERDELDALRANTLHLASGKAVPTDALVLCTGWGDHFAMFSDSLKAEIGLPTKGKAIPNETVAAGYDWATADLAADAAIKAKLPMLAHLPSQAEPRDSKQQAEQHHWRLYRRVVPLKHAESGDRSLAILGQIHTVQTPLVAEMQSFWAILYLLGELDLPGRKEMVREVAEWNAWTRKRYLSQGRKFPYSLYDFLPYVDTLCHDLGINSRRKSNPVAEIFAPYRPEDFNGFIDEYFANKSKKAVGGGNPRSSVSTVTARKQPIFGSPLRVWRTLMLGLALAITLACVATLFHTVP